MKFKHHSMLHYGVNGWVFILTFTQKQYRLYVFWRNFERSIYRWPVEFQVRERISYLPNCYTARQFFPRRRKSVVREGRYEV